MAEQTKEAKAVKAATPAKDAKPANEAKPAKAAKSGGTAKPAVPVAHPSVNHGHKLLRPDQVILRPLVTEKGVHRSSRHNAYAFEVAKEATKIDIRHAIEELFNVKVVDVNTQNRKGKPRRTRMKMTHTAAWKKAIVTLDKEHRIELF